MSTLAPELNPSYKTDFFSLTIAHRFHEVNITMMLFTDVVNTATLPHTKRLLQHVLPSVLQSRCFNDENLPFALEVKRTEIGHLFEHILLEYLCILKLEQGEDYAEFNGVTNWNWVVDPRGTFHITVDCGFDNKDILFSAIERSIQLLTNILQTSNSMLLKSKSSSVS